jgi:putative effector of murein hydrolase
VGVGGELGMQLGYWIDVGKHVTFLAVIVTGLSGTVCVPQLSERSGLDDRND